MQKIAIFPSLISADLLNLNHEISLLEPYCDGFHIDIMDYHFVPNLTWGIPFLHAFEKHIKKPLWIHLMIEKSYDFLQQITLRPHDIISFHIEENTDHKKIIYFLKEKKCKASIAISPKTALDAIFPYLADIDQVLLMAVKPGFSGQPFIADTFNSLKKLTAYKKRFDLSFQIGLDGGITSDNIAPLAADGATQFAIASAIFNHQDRIKALQLLYQASNKSTRSMLS